MRLTIAIVVLAVIAVGVVGAMIFGASQWRSKTDDLRTMLAAAPSPNTPATYDPREIATLPPPVQRYFRAALRDGQPIITRARVAWQGEFNMGKPGRDDWKPFTATQDFVPAAPGFVWDARIAMAPGLPVLVRDGFVEGVGSMHGAIWGLWPVVDAEGTPAIAAAALQRYLAEAAWLPTALLPSQGVTWTAIDETRSLATIRGGSITTSVEFRFGADGLIQSIFVPDRIFDNGKDPPAPHPWQGRNLNYQEQQGIKVPNDSVVEWLFPTGTFAYWRGWPTHIEYEYGLKGNGGVKSLS
jgi:hypothetical protein